MTNFTEKPIEISGNNPVGSVIWLHGLGADGHDFEPVVEMLNLPQFRFILPHAPYQKISMNNGYEMRAWYNLFGLSSQHPQDESGIQAACTYIQSLIAQENQRGMASERIVIAGFSQGGAVALHLALRQQQALAGVLALSTYLPLHNKVAAEMSQTAKQIPIFMAHGSFDEVISLERAKASLAILQAQNCQVEWHEYAMAHSVHTQEINDIRHFLLRVLPN